MGKRLIYIFLLLFSFLYSYGITEENHIESNALSNRIIEKNDSNALEFGKRLHYLNANDVISVYVYDNEEFTQEKLKIYSDGTIILAPFGEINVSGMTVNELHKVLTEKYKFYLKDPKVTIKLVETRPFVTCIRGAVRNPGVYELMTDTSMHYSMSSNETHVRQIDRKSPLLSNLIVAAGGIKFDADMENITITNKKTNEQYTVNLIELLNSGDTTQDIYLTEGDDVFVPNLSTPFAVNEENYKKYITSTFAPSEIPIKVFGYVNHPGTVKLNSYESITVNSAIMGAGGYLEDAAYAPSKVYLSRADSSGKLITKTINPMSNDIFVMPNDILYVPEKPRPMVGKAFDALTKMITPFYLYSFTWKNFKNSPNYNVYRSAI